MLTSLNLLNADTASAKPTAASAAAIVITKNTITWPSGLLLNLENATKLILIAFSINSTDINKTIKFRRSKRPAMPKENKIADSTK